MNLNLKVFCGILCFTSSLVIQAQEFERNCAQGQRVTLYNDFENKIFEEIDGSTLTYEENLSLAAYAHTNVDFYGSVDRKGMLENSGEIAISLYGYTGFKKSEPKLRLMMNFNSSKDEVKPHMSQTFHSQPTGGYKGSCNDYYLHGHYKDEYGKGEFHELPQANITLVGHEKKDGRWIDTFQIKHPNGGTMSVIIVIIPKN